MLLAWMTIYDQSELKISKFINGGILILMILCILESKIQFKGIYFPIGRVFISIGLLMGTYALFSGRILSEVYYVSKVFFWIVGSIFIYRMTLFGIITKKILLKAISYIVLFGSLLTVYFILNPVREATQNVGVYNLVWCLPFLMLNESKNTKLFLMGIACFAIALSLKRGAIIAMLTGIISYYFILFQMEKNIKAIVRLIAMIIISILLFLMAIFLLNKVKPEFVSYRFREFNRIEDVKELGSGRGDFYWLLINNYLDSLDHSLINFIIGYGSRSSQEVISKYQYHRVDVDEGDYAHSDWLQFMHDYGLVGIFFLVLMHISILKLIKISYSNRHPYTPQLVMCYSIILLKSLYSGVVFFPHSIYFGIFIAYFCAVQENNFYSTKKLC